MGRDRRERYVGSTKLSITILRPALSKSTVSLEPSELVTVPGPNLRCSTRAPGEKRDVEVDFASTCPSMMGACLARAGPPRGAHSFCALWARFQPGVV